MILFKYCRSFQVHLGRYKFCKILNFTWKHELYCCYQIGTSILSFLKSTDCSFLKCLLFLFASLHCWIEEVKVDRHPFLVPSLSPSGLMLAGSFYGCLYQVEDLLFQICWELCQMLFQHLLMWTNTFSHLICHYGEWHWWLSK